MSDETSDSNEQHRDTVHSLPSPSNALGVADRRAMVVVTIPPLAMLLMSDRWSLLACKVGVPSRLGLPEIASNTGCVESSMRASRS